VEELILSAIAIMINVVRDIEIVLCHAKLMLGNSRETSNFIIAVSV
jgi:hypothetical protein